jgi:hypothetical protein
VELINAPHKPQACKRFLFVLFLFLKLQEQDREQKLPLSLIDFLGNERDFPQFKHEVASCVLVAA